MSNAARNISCMSPRLALLALDAAAGGVGGACVVEAVSNVVTVDASNEIAVGICAGIHERQDDEASEDCLRMLGSALLRAQGSFAIKGSTCMVASSTINVCLISFSAHISNH